MNKNLSRQLLFSVAAIAAALLSVFPIVKPTTAVDPAEHHHHHHHHHQQQQQQQHHKKTKKTARRTLARVSSSYTLGPTNERFPTDPPPGDLLRLVDDVDTPAPTPYVRIAVDTYMPSATTTLSPTSQATVEVSNNECENIETVEEIRDGVKYTLSYYDNNVCRDGRGERYEYGEFTTDIESFEDCADACVQSVASPELLLHFRGIDFVCEENNDNNNNNNNKEKDDDNNDNDYVYSCRCLYDAGTLDNSPPNSLHSHFILPGSEGFDYTDTDYSGTGKVGGGGGGDGNNIAIMRDSEVGNVGIANEKDKTIICVKAETSSTSSSSISGGGLMDVVAKVA